MNIVPIFTSAPRRAGHNRCYPEIWIVRSIVRYTWYTVGSGMGVTMLATPRHLEDRTGRISLVINRIIPPVQAGVLTCYYLKVTAKVFCTKFKWSVISRKIVDAVSIVPGGLMGRGCLRTRNLFSVTAPGLHYFQVNLGIGLPMLTLVSVHIIPSLALWLPS